MVKLVNAVCPNCNATLKIEEDRKVLFCSYCGTQILLDDGTTKTIHEEIDRARIAETETEKAIRLEELKLENRKLEDEQRKQKLKFIKIVIPVIMILFGVIAVSTKDIISEGFAYTGFMFAVIGMILLMGNALNK